MAFIDTVRSIDWQQVFLILIAFVPYLDSETIGVVPLVRDIAPVEPIYVTEKSGTELLRLVALILAPLVDGEIIQLLTGRDVNEVIADS
jgi:hypothetical protein